ncbi:phytanoyl-CoA dioxygenase family protein [Paenibacillaceae bacterium]|nr:phytanoyl-CoA dioxygenase family protein [Paenibacillaceae bacterium]
MTDQLKEAYETDGYIILEKVFSKEEVKAFKAEIRRVIEQLQAEGKAEGFESHGVYVGLALQSEMFRALAADRRVSDVLQHVVGKSMLFLSDKLVAKDAAKDFPSPWHQDWPYWKGSHKVSVWIALDDATPENGCLKIIPGTHKTEVEHAAHANSKEGFSSRLPAELIDESKSVSIAAEAGSVVIFHDLTFHSSHQNISGKDRWALISTYKETDQPDPEFSWANPIPLPAYQA